MRHFCTLSDRGYLSKLLVMHESLLQHASEPFTLHVLALDLDAFRLLYDFNLENVSLIPLTSFEYALNMGKVKASRSWREYCWTAASNFMEYLMPWMDADGVTYLDADLVFFSDPKVIFDEIGTRSIGITPHRFPPERKHMEKNGRFNVGAVVAKNTPAGRKCITSWAKNCRDWCFDRVEGGKACGDQKYLDTWERDYPGEVCAIQNIGVNVAPWNMSQYHFTEGPKVDGVPVVFFHLHEFQGPDLLTYYPVRHEEQQRIYNPYVIAWTAANERIAAAEQKAAEERAELEMESQRA